MGKSSILETPTIAQKSRKGIVSLSVRSLLINGFQFVSVLVLSKCLYPQDYGVFGIINAWIGTAYYFADIGIIGALIGQSEEPSKKQLQSQFSVQLILSSILCFIFCYFAPMIVHHNKMSSDAVNMMRVLGFSLPIYALRGTPRLVFERQLRYSDLAQIDLAEAIIMYCVQITLALCGFGAWSLIAAIMSRSVAGTIFVYWKHPHFYLPIPSWTEIKKLLPFGIPFQANAILPALHGLVLPLVLTQFLSVNEIGLILWTMGLVSIPTFLAANYNQVIYSSLSRLQTDPVEIRRVASRATELAILIFGFIFGLGAASYVFIINTVFESKWAPAKFLMPVAILSVGFSISRYLAAPILNSSGKAYLRFKIEAIATVLEFILAWFLTSWSGSIGYLWATVIVNILALAICAYVVKYRLRKETGRRFVAVFAASLIPFLILSWGGWQKYLVPSLLIFIGGFFSILFILDSGAKADAKKVMEDVYGFIKAGFSKTNE